jgi:hypothetical protein
MNTFTFNRGVWEDGHSLPEWLDDEEYSNYFVRIGYEAKVSFGHEYGSQIEIYESSDSKKTFLASVSPAGNTCFEVFLPDFPSMMMFIRDHATVFDAQALNISQQEILALLEKSFQFQHGHSAHTICKLCDPVGWADNIRNQEERNKKQAVKG